MSRAAREKTMWSIAIGVVLLYAVIPIIWIISLSLKKTADIGDKEFLPIHGVSFDNYKSLFQTSDFTHALINSFGIAAISTTISLFLAAMAAYALARLKFAGKAVLLSGALAIAMFPQVSIVGSLFATWRSIGLFDTWPGLIIPYMTFSLPLAIYALTAFFREIPFELEEAAEVDGATPMQAFRRVILPLATPGIFTAGVLVFIIAWNDFLFATVLTSTNASRTVPATLAFFTGGSQFADATPQISAAAVVVTVPIIILVLIFQRRIVAGLTAGAVKG
jgi:multiple sugar transport system permease protein